jgi:glycosyltransferase involved in cell wall biosynthesis
MQIKKIYYWSPFLTKIATIDAVINSAISLKRYNKELYNVNIINVFGEFSEYEKKLRENNVNLINFKTSRIIKYFPKPGYLRSRFLSIYVFFRYFFSLKNLLRNNPPEFLIIHLITSLPLFLLLFFKMNTKVIFRISGYPKLNLLRKFFWKIAFKKIHRVTSPTIETKKNMIKEQIMSEDKIVLLRDPIISPNKINFLTKEPKKKNIDNYYISIGRLTYQKNYHFLIDCFYEIIKKDNTVKLIILGEGELKEALKKKIDSLKMNNNISLLGYQDNVYGYLKGAKAFILSSLWEDPGFVLIEAAFCNLPIISSNCPNGPSEILNKGKDGFMYESNSKKDFLIKFEEYLSTDNKDLFIKKLCVKKNSKNFTYFKHSEDLKKIL